MTDRHPHEVRTCSCGVRVSACPCVSAVKTPVVVPGGCGRCVRAAVANHPRSEPR